MRITSLILFLCFLYYCESYDMIIGDTVHRKMVFHQRVKDFAIPFKKRIKVLTYNDPEKRIIKGVAAIDNDFSHASANITDGGVGFSHVTVRMKSQRHHPLNFEVEIYF
ncbi:probable salivary secreted peptide isoform X2 [Nymphalis io]|uniref:probable salivary secreted peptide isoform X2 n=1 Tax=Inachis io TaxID=171585 RepID=UPI00216A1A67|nr:probable salivary secreted peptide isoform X2 [Nymphalis io]